MNRFKLTKEMLDDESTRGQVIASGISPNSPEGLFMTNDNYGKTLRWVLKKGWGYSDWAVYCHWTEHSEEWVRDNGDKVTSRQNLQNIIEFDDECWSKYRF